MGIFMTGCSDDDYSISNTPLLTDENIKAEFIKLDIGYGMFDHNQVQELTDLAVKQTEQAGGYIKASMQ